MNIKWYSVSTSGSRPAAKLFGLHAKHNLSCTSRRGLEKRPDSILSSSDPNLIFAKNFFCRKVNGLCIQESYQIV